MMEPKISVQQYLIALRENILLGLKCRDCGFITAPPRLSCRKCAGQDTEITRLSGKGNIATFTTVYISTENRKLQTPYIVVMVELDEGPWIIGNLNGFDPASASIELIGTRVIMDNTSLDLGQESEDGIVPQFVRDN